VALLLAPGALGASLKAGGLTQGAEGVIRRELGEKANIMATGGRTDGFAPSDGAAITNFGGTTTFTSAGVGFNGGTTTSFDNFRNPVVNEGGFGRILRRLGEQAAAAANLGRSTFFNPLCQGRPAGHLPFCNPICRPACTCPPDERPCVRCGPAYPQPRRCARLL
jgi:hypothetical protein